MPVAPALFEQLVHALSIVLPLTAPADRLLSNFFRANPRLGQRDRALIADTVYAILRRRRYVELLAPQGRPRDWALLGLNRLQGVTLRELEPLLRGREHEWLAQTRSLESESLPLPVRLDLPDWLAESLVGEWGEAETIELARALCTPAPPDLRVNTFLTTRAQVLDEFRREGLDAEPTPYSPIGVRLASKLALQRHRLFLNGAVEVQDEGSQLLGLLVEPRRTDMVVDFCAGAGGKALLLGAAMQSRGRVYAFDVADKRLARLRPRLARSGLSNIHPQRLADEKDIRVKRLAGKIDRVLVDAPCSGLGTLRRNPDLKWRQTRQSVNEMTAKQAAILGAAAALLKPGGRLVYATCSLLRQENEAIVAAFLASHPQFTPVDAAAILRRLGIGLDTGTHLRLLPHRHGTDGFFAAVMQRHDSGSQA